MFCIYGTEMFGSKFKRLVIGILAITASAFIALWVKDLVDRSMPEYAVPKISVTADEQRLDAKLYGYYWTFYMGEAVEVVAPIVSDIYDKDMPPISHLKGGEELKIDFSQTPEYKHVNRGESYTYIFSPAENETHVPYEPGSYIYEVLAGFERGTVTYYFIINVEG